LALTNQARGLLSEYGVVFGKGDKAFREGIAAAMENPDLSPLLRDVLIDIQEEYHFIQRKLEHIKARITQFSRQDSNSRLLESIPGVGPVIATAVTSTVYNGAGFANAREFAVWTGLTPNQSSSADKSVTSGVTKRGNAYLRKQLVHGARAAMRWARYRDDEFSRWVNRLIARQGYNKAAVAVAHRLARIIWILLQKQERFVVRA
jgi:transposase